MINNPTNSRIRLFTSMAVVLLLLNACGIPNLKQLKVDQSVPTNFAKKSDTLKIDTTNTAQINWKIFFNDPYLNQLIDTALQNNQEFNIVLQELQIAKNEIGAKKGEYLPFVGFNAGAGIEKTGEYTRDGAVEKNLSIQEGQAMPEPLPDFRIGLQAKWEIDIWNKLHNAQKAAVLRYLSTIEGKNFMQTHLIAEIANAYYELLSLDNQLKIVKQNIDIQRKALNIVKLQKKATRVNELAVRKFEAEVFHTRSLQYKILQQITETENHINFLVGRFPQPIVRNADSFTDLVPKKLHKGIPSQLLENRPDIKQAEYELEAAKLDIQVAKSRFYPSLGIAANLGYQAFNPTYLLKPQSLIYTLAGELTAPLINKKAIKAAYKNANAKQIQAVYSYEQTLLEAYIEVSNQFAKINNLKKSYDLKTQEVEALTASITIANRLFKSARADYMEVLLTQRDALASRFDLVETKQQQMNAVVNMYQALGGGWQ